MIDSKSDYKAVILIDSLTRQFGKLVVVNNISLRINRGEIYGFLGLNGAGKTTTIRMMMGLVKPSSGSVSLFGTRVHPGVTSIWTRVGYMIETPYSYPELSVRQNLEIVRRLRRVSEKKSVDDVIELLGLNREAEKSASKLSMGNRQRLGLAKALIHKPDLLVLDEPANGLDPAGIVEVRNLLLSLANEHGVTIFMSSHILTEVVKLATRIGVIHEGKLVKELYARDLENLEQPRLSVTVNNRESALSLLRNSGFNVRTDHYGRIILFDEKAMEHPETIATMLVNAGYPPSRLVTEHEDLETYFLELTGH